MSKTFLLESDVLHIGKNGDIKIDTNDIIIDFKNKRVIAEIIISHNYRLMKENIFNFEYNDVLQMENLKIVVKDENSFTINDNSLDDDINFFDISKLENGYESYPEYTNSPRIKISYNEDKIKIEQPPEKEKKQTKGDLFKQLVPAVVGVGIMIAMLYVRPRGTRGLLMAMSSLTSFAIAMINIYSVRKENKEFNRNRTDTYEKYILDKRKELSSLQDEYIDSVSFNNPSQSAMIDYIEKNSYRLYERDILEDDFLALRLGLYTDEPSFKLSDPFDKIKLDFDDLEIQAKQAYLDYKEVENLPLIIRGNKNLGLIGNKFVIYKQLHSILMQYYFMQSYLDSNIILITNERKIHIFEYLKYLRHIKNPYTKMNNIISDASSRDQLLNSYTQILRQRKTEYKQGIKFIPHITFIVDELKLIDNHPIMEFLQDDSIDLGFNLVYITHTRDELPKNIHTVVKYDDDYNATLVIEEGELKNINFRLENVEHDTNKLELKTRRIGQLEHIKGIKSSIPESLGFLEMYNVNTTQDLNISDRWNENKSYKSLAALIGKKSDTDYIELNLHEKVHGPHGLIAGTTGSGKSEVIQTYILSLALNYSPYEVGFLLIDYKGGGMAGLFKNLPHHLGSITNLDGYQSLRALASIKSELKRRQKIFSENDVNHINGYHKLFEKGGVSEPLPHLFLISDEFAELKAEQPDFMSELVSAARIGRSLGIHLILATQKPSGVVDEQIWSNSKFKLSLKVAEESDSKEMLKTPDAAYITQPGRGYLKVGTNELYELFQSGYSGAKYIQEENFKIDERVYLIDKVNHKELLNPEAIEDIDEEKDTESITELQAVLQEIDNVYINQKMETIKKPWLPPLSEFIYKEFDTDNLSRDIVEIGLVDIPHMQSQITFNVNFNEKGHLLIVGGQGSGKTMLLDLLITRLAYKNSSKDIKFILLDFGNSGLINYKDLNHTMEYINANDESKHIKFEKYIEEEMYKRKVLLEEQRINNHRKSSTPIQQVYIAIDNYALIHELEDDFKLVVSEIIKNGPALGIFLMITTTRTLDIKGGLLNNFNQRIVLYSPDSSEVAMALARSSYPLASIPGRGQVLIEDPEVVQFYSPVKVIDEYTYEVREKVQSINEKYQYNNQGFITVPQIIDYERNVFSNNAIYLGKLHSNLKNAKVKLDNILIGGGNMSGKTNLLKIILEQLVQDINLNITIVDDSAFSLKEYSLYENVDYITDVRNIDYTSNIYIVNKFNRFDKLKKKELDVIYEELFLSLINGAKIITEVGVKGIGNAKDDLIQKIKSSAYYLHFGPIDSQNMYPYDKKMKKKDKYEFSDAYVFKGNTIRMIRTPKVITKTENQHVDLNKSNKIEKPVEKDIVLKDSVILGNNELFVDELNRLKNGKDVYCLTNKADSGNYIKNITTLSNDLKGNIIYINDVEYIEGLPVKERRSLLATLDDIAEYNIILYHPTHKAKLLSETIKNFKNCDSIFVLEKFNPEKMKDIHRVRNKKVVDQPINGKSYIYINGKEIYTVKYR